MRNLHTFTLQANEPETNFRHSTHLLATHVWLHLKRLLFYTPPFRPMPGTWQILGVFKWKKKNCILLSLFHPIHPLDAQNCPSQGRPFLNPTLQLSFLFMGLRALSLPVWVSFRTPVHGARGPAQGGPLLCSCQDVGGDLSQVVRLCLGVGTWDSGGVRSPFPAHPNPCNACQALEANLTCGPSSCTKLRRYIMFNTTFRFERPLTPFQMKLVPFESFGVLFSVTAAPHGQNLLSHNSECRLGGTSGLPGSPLLMWKLFIMKVGWAPVFSAFPASNL